jgi:hypothetical protein
MDYLKEFPWVSCKSDIEQGIDRIMRSIFKKDIAEGGLNMTDIECLNK